ncbi:MAG: hypothetical protein ACP5F8_03055, partial [Candidatus Aenigmatarchaeota archaeon]
EFGTHSPIHTRESIMAIGDLEKDRIVIEAYVPHLSNCEGRCERCRYAKIYMGNGENGWKEKNGYRNIYGLKISGARIANYGELEKEARSLGFPYV